MDDFRGKVGVITGGASGIGLATAKRLAREGMNLVLADIEQAALDRAVPEVEALGVDVIGVRTDVGDRDSVRALADTAFGRFGKVHLTFHNAGVAVAGPIQDMTHADWEWLMRVNLWGVIHGVEAFTKRMIDQGEGGHILATASFAGLVPNSGLGVYCVTKYGVVALMECLYRDVSNYGIGVSVLCPMRVETNIDNSSRNRPPDLAETGAPPRLQPNESIPAGSLAGGTITPEEVADKVFDAVRKGELYILPHPEARPFVQRRFQRIDRAFEA